MAAAERLFGELGIEAVSIRQLTLAAGAANNSAVAYHFGDRAGLLRAITRWRQPDIEAERERVYAAARDDGALDDPARIIAAIAFPVMAIRGPDGAHPHVAFVYQMLRSPAGREIRAAAHASGRLGEMFERLHRHVPEIAEPLFRFRIRTASVALYDAVVERDRFIRDSSDLPHLNDEQFLREMGTMMQAMILRPAHSA